MPTIPDSQDSPPRPPPEPAALAESSAPSAPEPVLDALPEPVLDALPEPVLDALPEPVLDALPEPVLDALPEPVPAVRARVLPALVPGRRALKRRGSAVVGSAWDVALPGSRGAAAIGSLILRCNFETPQWWSRVTGCGVMLSLGPALLGVFGAIAGLGSWLTGGDAELLGFGAVLLAPALVLWLLYRAPGRRVCWVALRRGSVEGLEVVPRGVYVHLAPPARIAMADTVLLAPIAPATVDDLVDALEPLTVPLSPQGAAASTALRSEAAPEASHGGSAEGPLDEPSEGPPGGRLGGRAKNLTLGPRRDTPSQ